MAEQQQQREAAGDVMKGRQRDEAVGAFHGEDSASDYITFNSKQGARRPAPALRYYKSGADLSALPQWLFPAT
jgi:hypothetical protein